MNPKVYLETTVFNYYFIKDPKRAEEILNTKKLFEQIRKGKLEPYISEVTIGELEACPDRVRREKMFNLIKELDINMLDLEGYAEYENLAEKYILSEAIPPTKKRDALHISIATLAKMDILVSWNCDHIVRYKTQQIVKVINRLEGLDEIAINTPKEVLVNE